MQNHALQCDMSFALPVDPRLKARVSVLVESERQSVAHRMDHLARVSRNAAAIAQHYGEVDREILGLAVLLHDVEQPFDDKANHVERSAAVAERLMSDINVEPTRIAHVLKAIREHSTENIVAPSSLEAKILFDADKLDGIGPNGILRVFALSQQMGRPIAASIAWYRGKIDVALANLRTPEGRALAAARLPLVESFLTALEVEL